MTDTIILIITITASTLISAAISYRRGRAEGISIGYARGRRSPRRLFDTPAAGRES